MGWTSFPMRSNVKDWFKREWEPSTSDEILGCAEAMMERTSNDLKESLMENKVRFRKVERK